MVWIPKEPKVKPSPPKPKKDDAPTIDAVEVVRCKECKHSHMTYDGRCKYCDKWEGDGEALYLEGDFYCAFGERREDGEA